MDSSKQGTRLVVEASTSLRSTAFTVDSQLSKSHASTEDIAGGSGAGSGDIIMGTTAAATATTATTTGPSHLFSFFGSKGNNDDLEDEEFIYSTDVDADPAMTTDATDSDAALATGTATATSNSGSPTTNTNANKAHRIPLSLRLKPGLGQQPATTASSTTLHTSTPPRRRAHQKQQQHSHSHSHAHSHKQHPRDDYTAASPEYKYQTHNYYNNNNYNHEPHVFYAVDRTAAGAGGGGGGSSASGIPPLVTVSVSVEDEGGGGIGGGNGLLNTRYRSVGGSSGGGSSRTRFLQKEWTVGRFCSSIAVLLFSALGLILLISNPLTPLAPSVKTRPWILPTDTWRPIVTNITSSSTELYSFDFELMAVNWGIVWDVVLNGADLEVFVEASGDRIHRQSQELLAHIAQLSQPAIFPPHSFTLNATASIAIDHPSSTVGKIIYMNYPYKLILKGYFRYTGAFGVFSRSIPVCSVHLVESWDVITSRECLQ
ncbi:hypothetical protein BDR26DRAFT_85684 [Obelidium mucronatum]|nr:hypothetical protein BDR26DRAFT_85684 [Obelidium mucronatum]